MRFGIMTTQTDILVPSGLSPEGVMAHLTNFDQSEVVRDLFAQGFNPVELNGDLPMFLPHLHNTTEVGKLAALKEELGVEYTFHLPLWSVELSTSLEQVRRGSVEAIIEAVQATRDLDPEIYVLHATGSLGAEFYRMDLPEIAKSILLRQFQSNARRSLKAILKETGLPSRKLAIETVEFPFDLTLELAEDLDLSMCFDTGHIIVGFSGPVGVFEALERCLPRLGEVHLQDGPWQGPERNIGYGQDHKPLGEGDLDTARFLDRLAQADFDGPVIFELTIEETLASMEVVRSLRPGLLDS